MKNLIYKILSSFLFAILFTFTIKADNIEEEKIPISIAMSSDNNYAYPMIVSMTSILENKNPNTKIDFYLMLSGDFDDSMKNKILSLQEKYNNCSVTTIDMKDSMSQFLVSRHLKTATITDYFYLIYYQI